MENGIEIEDYVISKRFFRDRQKFNFGNMFGIRSKTIKELQAKIRNGQLTTVPLEKCHICGGRRFSRIAAYDRYGFSVDQLLCRNCALVQTTPNFDSESMSCFYSNYYRSLQEGLEEEKGFSRRFKRQVRNGRKVFKRLSGHLKNVEECKLIEVGCGGGGIVSVFADHGYSIVGYDTDNTYLKYGVDKYELPLINSLAPEQPEVLYDAMILRHVLEHILDPKGFICGLKKMLRPDGLLYVEVPGLLAVNDGKYDFDLMKYFVIEHVSIFHLANLKSLFEKVGFEMVEGNEDIYAIFKLAPKATTPNKINTGVAESVLGELMIAEKRYVENKKSITEIEKSD